MFPSELYDDTDNYKFKFKFQLLFVMPLINFFCRIAELVYEGW
ncbi:hypothetical protein Q457_10715 [Escherichia coli ATCC BAA-2196]|nr:hypothetical protein FORC28_3034 [Escherichia coli]ETD59279.1 hypothetical protein Q459_03655 [Escherichia coli ATCC BAA-2215]ETI77546.1 hypothetical protein Q457_10715 [Escherichia coli ATCC BAA-2196]ETJ57001.1 hypothetical protein Q456_0220810 [Escherichia coli ATCC BAA-2193]